MLLRLFVHLYEMEVIEEQAFVKWKEQVSDEYPGKGKALFQVTLFYFITFWIVIQIVMFHHVMFGLVSGNVC